VFCISDTFQRKFEVAGPNSFCESYDCCPEEDASALAVAAAAVGQQHAPGLVEAFYTLCEVCALALSMMLVADIRNSDGCFITGQRDEVFGALLQGRPSLVVRLDLWQSPIVVSVVAFSIEQRWYP
jgi:hypothetical protein